MIVFLADAQKFKTKFQECQAVNQAVADGKEVPHVEPIKDEQPQQ